MTGFGAAGFVSLGTAGAAAGFASSTEITLAEWVLGLGALSESSGGAAAGVTSRPTVFGVASLSSHARSASRNCCEIFVNFKPPLLPLSSDQAISPAPFKRVFPSRAKVK